MLNFAYTVQSGPIYLFLVLIVGWCGWMILLVSAGREIFEHCFESLIGLCCKLLGIFEVRNKHHVSAQAQRLHRAATVRDVQASTG